MTSFKCGNCKKHFKSNEEQFRNRDECESGYGHCPHCGSQYHSGNCEEIEA